MRFAHLTRLIAGLMLALLVSTRANAATDLTVTVTLTIPATISVVWCDNAGANDSTTAQTWALGSVALATPYVSDTQGTQPVLKYIQNLSNASVDIAAVCSNSTSWSVVTPGALGSANQFAMESNHTAGAYSSLHASVTDFIDDLAFNAFSGQILLRLTTPTSITIGGGLTQTITVTYTASADNGD
jgi:hypothetical protein